MQTFLPYASFKKSAACLDYRRLGKQRVECKQILIAIEKKKENPSVKAGWVNHPCTLMWFEHPDWLVEYSIAICEEWLRRGYKDSLLPFFKSHSYPHSLMPLFIGNRDFHESHKSNLIRKDPSFYKPKFKNTVEGLQYIWSI